MFGLTRVLVLLITIVLVLPVLIRRPEVQAGEIRYVQPSVEVPVRRGQGTEYKIVKLIKDGDRVELLSEGESWAKIRVANGTEGWMPKRFLSKQAPPVKQLEILQSENTRLKEENAQLQSRLEELQDVQSTTGGELSTCIAERDDLDSRYQALKTETADVMAIKTEADQTKKKMVRMQAVFTELQQQNNDLRRKSAMTWFLAGAGVLLIGWLIGLITCRSKKRRPSLL